MGQYTEKCSPRIPAKHHHSSLQSPNKSTSPWHEFYVRRGKNTARAFAYIQEQPLPHPHHRGISNLSNVSSAAQSTAWEGPGVPSEMTAMSRASNVRRVGLRCRAEGTRGVTTVWAAEVIIARSLIPQ